MTASGDDVFALLADLTGYQRAAVVTAATRIGLFDELGDEPVAVADLADRLGLAGPRTLDAMLSVLAGMGLVRRTGVGVARAGSLASALTRDGDLTPVVEKEALFARLWLDLHAVARSDGPSMAPWRERLRTEPRRCRAFLVALDTLARRTGPKLDQVPGLAGPARVLDVGGGLGSYARLLAGSGSHVTLVDIPPVTAWAREELADLTSAVEVVEADVLTHPSCGVPPASHDAALVSHLLHDLDDRDAVTALRTAMVAVRPGGVIVVNDFGGDVGPGTFGPVFDVMMRVETGSRARTVAQLLDLMHEAGAIDAHRLDLPDPQTVLVGRVAGDAPDAPDASTDRSREETA